MKKLVLLLVVLACSILFAQTTPTAIFTGTSGSVSPAVDVLGAHNNYGRGCAGCHAPHSGNFGAGGNGITGTTKDLWTGTNALFAQDMGPLYGKSLDFSNLGPSGSSSKYTLATPAAGNPTAWTPQQYADVRGILMCLACHDGNVARGAMMQNYAYEQQIGALPSTYGGGKIPTLLANDGTAAGDYNNDHPIGENATLDLALGTTYGDSIQGLVYVTSGASVTSITVAPGGQYQQFMTSYGAPALMKGAYVYPTPVNASGLPYVVCTTCHNQHVMNVYAATATSPIAGKNTGTYGTFFFVNAPYDVGNTGVQKTDAISTTQFCRQCHFRLSNEAHGGTFSTNF
jgi:hypothetical protein